MKSGKVYKGLSKSSSFEDFQAILHETHPQNSSCPKPCTGQLKGDPLLRVSLFCFSVIRPTGYEPMILRAQLERGAGIFACDGSAVFSEGHFTLGPGPSGAVETVPFVHAEVGK